MAKQTKSTPVVPDFKDVDKGAVDAAQAALAGGRQDPLKPGKGAKVSEDKNGNTYTRWTERAVISQAYRSVTKNGLLDVTVVAKIRQGDNNNGKKVFSHFYINNLAEVPEKHELMNARSIGAIATLLVATGFMPAGGALKGTVLNKMFPQKGQPGTSSPLVSKTIVVNVVQQYQQAKDLKTGKARVDEDGEAIMEKRDSGESFLPDAKSLGKAAAAADEDETEEE